MIEAPNVVFKKIAALLKGQGRYELTVAELKIAELLVVNGFGVWVDCEESEVFEVEGPSE